MIVMVDDHGVEQAFSANTPAGVLTFTGLSMHHFNKPVRIVAAARQEHPVARTRPRGV
ncbi:hypothetical protein [Kibdelosporangium philippinense]|uniref:hypothetical protein n=1 Tax=Kibdelosporangium philippinense TaxID=211113 RepID=UPI003611619A